MNGQRALLIGIIAAGVRFGAAILLPPVGCDGNPCAANLPKYGGTFVQCEDEIAAISMANARASPAGSRHRLQRARYFAQDGVARLG